MKWVEYRIVGTKNMKHKNGKIDVIENIHPYVMRYCEYRTYYKDLSEAKRDCQEAQEKIAEWEKKHNMNAIDDKYGVEVHWTDIHIESREVSDWEEVK